MTRIQSKLQIVKDLETELTELKKRNLDNLKIYFEKLNLYNDLLSKLPKFRPHVWRNKKL